MLRRTILASGLAVAGLATARAQGPAAGAPLRLGVDLALMDSGLGRSLLLAFGSDTGIAVKLVPGPATAVLDATQNGELDAALTNAPQAEAVLEKQTLVHDRRAIASGQFLLVGPAGKGRPAAPGRSASELLTRLKQQAGTEPLVFLSAGDGSGTHLAEQALWRAAGIEPLAPWYVKADHSSGFAATVRARGAFAVVERGAWANGGGAPLVVLVEGDPLLAESVHAMRSFRATHPAGKIFLAWIGGHRGRSVVAAHRNYLPPA